MKALRWHGRKDIRLDDILEPVVGSGEVKVRIKWCGICGSDIYEWQVGPLMVRETEPHPLTGKTAPVTLGHEFSGDVAEIDSDVAGINVGDRVTVRPTIPCYKCHWCRKGRYVQCAMLATIGLAADGGFAEYIVVPSDNVYKLPDQVTYEMAAFTEPLAVAVHAVKRSRLVPGDTVAVVGAGAIGLLVMQAAVACGAAKVIVLETVPRRLQLANELGAAAVINPTEGDAGKAIAGLTDGLRADIAFECAGPCDALLLALKVSGRGGTIVEVGAMTEPCEFPFASLFMHEKTIITSQGYSDEFPIALSFLASGRINCDAMISAKIKLENIIAEGFEEMVGEHKTERCRILVSPQP